MLVRVMFITPKLLSAITQPLFWLALLWAAALLLLPRRPGWAVRMLWAGLVTLGLLGFRAGPDTLLRPLENRYPVQTAEAVHTHVGVVVLGGALEHPGSYATHGQVPLGDAAERMTVPVALLRQHPHWDLVFSGGEGRLLATGTSETELARVFFEQQGLKPGPHSPGRRLTQRPRKRPTGGPAAGPALRRTLAVGDIGLAHAARHGRVCCVGLQRHALPGGLSYRGQHCPHPIQPGPQPAALANGLARVVGLGGLCIHTLGGRRGQAGHTR